MHQWWYNEVQTTQSHIGIQTENYSSVFATNINENIIVRSVFDDHEQKRHAEVLGCYWLGSHHGLSSSILKQII